MSTEDLLDQINKGILELNSNKVKALIREAIGQGIDVISLINDGLTAGLRKLGERFERGEAFLPELLKGAQIVQSSVSELEVNINEKDAIQNKGTLMIGTVEGDIHDVGKNIVCTVISSAGYRVIDLGVNVPTERFVEKVRAEKPDLLGLSALLTTTMINQRRVIDALEAEGLRKGLKVILGGAPVSQSWAKQVGADAYAEDAFSALRKVEDLMGSK
ncbi:cobalamin-binding protein [Methanosarcinales archaeon]|nr:MAG: cobalamin-binding protein [Methanosarcinales archaeon]